MIGNIKTFAITFFSILVLIAPCVARAKVNDNNPSTNAGGIPVTVFGPKGFQRTTGQPNVFQETFTATRGAGQLDLFNGQVTSAWVVLNGKQILGPDDFKKGAPFLEAPLTLEAQNTLQIKLASEPGTYVAARITQAFPFEDDNSGVIKADLAVTDLVLTPDRCAPQTPVSVQATVTNFGRQNSGPAILIVTIDGSEIGRVTVNPLQVGASASFAINWTAQGPGRHQVWASVQPGAGMIDPSPGNNSRLATLRVSGETPPVPELEFGPPQFDPASSQITLNVRNPSFADLSNIWLWLSVVGPSSLAPQTLQNSAGDPPTPNSLTTDQNSCEGFNCPPPPDFIIASLAAGTSTVVQFDWPYGTAGQYVVGVRAGNLPDNFPVEESTASWDLVLPFPMFVTNNQPSWSSMGPYLITDEYGEAGPNTGHIRSLAIHPQNPNIIYAAGVNYSDQISGAGIWKTIDGGQSWTPLGDGLPQMNITAIAVDPINPDIVYCAGGQWWGLNPPTPVAQALPPPISYIFKSIDGGQSWNLFAHPADGYSKLVVQRFFNGDVMIYAASNRGVFRYLGDDPWALSSQDSEWTVILDGKIGSMVVHPTNSDVVFAARYYPSGSPDGIYRTTTGILATGDSDWKKIFPGDSPLHPDRQMYVDLFQANPQKVYVFTWDPLFSGLSLWTNEIGGDWNGWNLAFESPITCGGNGVNFLRAHPTIDNLVYVGCEGGNLNGVAVWGNLLRIQKLWSLWYSFDVPDLHADQHVMEFFPDSNSAFNWGYVLGNDGGVYRGEYSLAGLFMPPGLTPNFVWENVTPINNGLVSAEFDTAGFDVSPINPDVMIGGTQDNGVVIYQPDSNPYPEWKSVGNFGDGFAAVIAPSDPKTMYGMDSGDHIKRSTNGGGDWQEANQTGLPNAAPPIFTDPSFANQIYLGGPMGVQESVNGGDNWQQIGPSLIAGSIVQVLRTGAPLSGGEIFLFAGTDTGQLWAARWIPGAGFDWQHFFQHPDPNARVVSMVSPDRGEPYDLYVAYQNCTDYRRLAHFFRNASTGGQWVGEWITGNLPEIHATTNTKVEIYTIALHPTDPSTVFVGTDKGIYQGMPVMSPGFGVGWFWAPFNNGLPLVMISKLISIPSTGELRAATYGRGVWTVTLSPPSGGS